VGRPPDPSEYLLPLANLGKRRDHYVMREAGRNSKPPHAADVRLARRREGERLAEQYGIDAGIADPLQPEHAGTDAAEMQMTRIQPVISSLIRGVDHRQDKRRHAMVKPRYSRRCAVQGSKRSLKHDLECLRLASDCMHLVGDAGNPALQRHFLRMASVWTAKAERGLAADTQESCFPKT
jgi:hypothetical protein